jgi:hypothetical protein
MVLFNTRVDKGCGSGTGTRFRLTTSPEPSRVMRTGGNEVIASPRIGDSGDEDDMRVQTRYSAELG